MNGPLTSLAPFFAPHGIAVVGASNDPTKLGYGLARNLVQSNFQGEVHFVNPRGGILLGRPIITSIERIPDPVDLAILLIPAPAVPAALEECARRGIRAVVIGSGGFRETGPDGETLEKECLRIAEENRMRLIGPNCIGLLDTHLPLDATFLPPPGPLPGDVAFISHSGAICAAVIDWARGQGFGLSRLVSLGNQIDVNETDTLAAVAEDRFTRVLTLYLEGVSNGRRFVQEASRISRLKPIIALKVGRFASGQKAVASHTGALAGQESAFNAAFRRAGVIRAESSEEMFDWARALAWCPAPDGRPVAVLTNAGGPGVTAADALEAAGLPLAQLSEDTVRALQSILPPAASLNNPVDMLASASPEQYAGSLRTLLEDPGVYSALVILPPPPMFTAGAVAKAMIPIIHASKKPVVVALMGERLIQEAVEHFRAARVPEYRFPERAASALGVLVQRAESLKRNANEEAESVETSAGINQPLAQSILEKWLSAQTDQSQSRFLPPKVVDGLLNAYGIPTLPEAMVHTSEQAVEAAVRMGLGQPDHAFVLKIISPDIPHKSDVGGVLLNLIGEEEIRLGFEAVISRVREAVPEARITGVQVQMQALPGQEVIVGAVQDAQFGALVMFGSGGVEVEGLKDVAFALAPLKHEEADYLLENTWAGRKLAGFRNLLAADRQAVKEVLFRLGSLAADFPELSELEINPLRVMPVGKGVCALDGRARYTPRGS